MRTGICPMTYSGIDGVSTAQTQTIDLPLREPITLSAAQIEQIVAHGRAGKPEEICGIVRGAGSMLEGEISALEVIRAQNVADERIQNYTVDPKTLLLQFAFEDAGERMVAIYHSHPVSPAFPSATDAWNANYPETVYLILSLADDANPVLRGWALEVEEVALDWDAIRRDLPFFEARTGLFAYFQGTDTPLPALLDVGIAAPFYLVYALDEAGEVIDERLVSVREHKVLRRDES